MDAKRLERLLGGCVPLVYEDVTASTNDDAKSLASRGRLPILVVAERQTNGKGRFGRSFASPEGGVYLSLACPCEWDDANASLLTSYVGVCVCESLEATHGLRAGIKWVNDIYVDGCKLAGILVERAGSHVVVGVGINGRIVPELAGGVRATALAEHVERVDLEALGADVARRLVLGIREGIDAEVTVAACRQRSVLLGYEVHYMVGVQTRQGVAVDIDEGGALLVRTARGIERLTSVTCNVRLAK